MSNHKQPVVIALFVVPNVKRKWNQSQQKQNVQSLVQTPYVFTKHQINAYGVIRYKYKLKDVQQQAAKYGNTMYTDCIDLSTAKQQRWAFHIQHFHILCQPHDIPKTMTPQGWGKVDKISNIINVIIDDNSAIREYIKKYIVTFKLLAIHAEYLSAMRITLKLFEIRPNLKCIPEGPLSDIKTIFEESQPPQHIIHPSSKKRKNPFNDSMNKNKRRKLKKQLKKDTNIKHINTFIKEANQKILNQVNECMDLNTLKSNNPEYLYLAAYAEKTWGIKWNEFIECKQFHGGKQFINISEKKTVSQICDEFQLQQIIRG